MQFSALAQTSDRTQKVTAPDAILQLVEEFDRDRDAYRSGKYNEAQIRREFVLSCWEP